MRGMTFSWLIATACALLCVLCGFAIGSLFELGETAWRVSAQPIATVLAGLGALAAGLLAYFNGVRLRELQSEQHRSDSVRDREARLHERYSTAAAQLADASPAIREAGVYALGSLIDDWIRLEKLASEPGLGASSIQSILNLLCSYLRANRNLVPIDGRSAPTSDERLIDDEFPVRASIVSLLADRLHDWRTSSTTEISIKINLAGARLRGARLDRSDLRSANLVGANLSGAKLRFALLQNAQLDAADLSGADLTGTDLTGTSLANVVRSAATRWPSSTEP